MVVQVAVKKMRRFSLCNFSGEVTASRQQWVEASGEQKVDSK